MIKQIRLISYGGKKNSREESQEQRVQLIASKTSIFGNKSKEQNSLTLMILNECSKRAGNMSPDGFQNCYGPMMAIFFPFFLLLNGSIYCSFPIPVSPLNAACGQVRWKGRQRCLFSSRTSRTEEAAPKQ